MKQKPVTIYDIAKEAKVSTATVSRVIANNYPVSEKTKKMVLDLIKKYDYQPNAVARSLTKKESKMIGFILPDITNPFFAQVFIEAEKYALTKGYTLILGNSMNSNEIESKYLRDLSERQVEGIIFMGGRINKSQPDHMEINELKDVMNKIPVIMVNGKIDGINCSSVHTNEAKGIDLVIEHLVSHDHKKIGLIGGVKGVTTTDIKVNAYWRSLTKHGLLMKENWQIYSGYDVDSGRKAVETFIHVNESDLPTALIGINDLVIIGALKACRQNHLHPFSFVGFDNTDLTKNATPEITSVSHPYKDLGEKAIDLIIHTKTMKPEEIWLDPYLAIRESTNRPH
ncbi:LacI family transcriptional regulator [Gracilibacillus caseinilyticus]|uniref:LacI family transcriptional regulator n=1 Tax=Gracilibacillus caseinilyticus TaxID=2932256 RepID=A0ABY4F1K8_9BACI|nr:LacI family DNA-binding transcriptional regulator [Gracilibacillus caseinilyticus]UOQ50430.1 LacI family transcriptional regulator [Gracilibacillus caseinilyticus]